MTRTFSTPQNFKYWAIINGLVLLFWTVIGLFYPLVDLSENQTLYIYSTIAQVVAGIFGLTITGYIFLRNQQDRLVDKDDSLAEIFDRIQGGQHRLVQFITVLSAAAIFSSLLVIALRELNHPVVKSLSQNFSTVLFVSVILWTGYFIAEVTRPENVSKTSEDIKDEIAQNAQTDEDAGAGTSGNDGYDASSNNVNDGKGNFVEFLSTFNEFEKVLGDAAIKGWSRKGTSPVMIDSAVIMNSEFGKDLGLNRRWPISKIIKMLVAEGVMSAQTAREASDMIRYRNALVHGQGFLVDRVVLERLVDLLRKVREELEKYFRSGDQG